MHITITLSKTDVDAAVTQWLSRNKGLIAKDIRTNSDGSITCDAEQQKPTSSQWDR